MVGPHDGRDGFDRFEEDYRRVVEFLRAADSALFITGAGISADSGVPTYRGIGGLYNAGDPDEGIPIEDILTPWMLRRRPDLTWKHLAAIGKAARGAEPNAAHRVIAQLEEHLGRVCVLTQNVDGLHTAAGSTSVLEIHGNMHHVYCETCGWRDEVRRPDEWMLPPKCPDCGAVIRPSVVLFGEMLPTDVLARLDEELQRGFDVVFSVGTTSVFPYIAAPVHAASAAGRPTVEINPGHTDVSDRVDVHLRTSAATALTEIQRRLLGRPEDD